ncbi:MAG: cytochrome c [Hyphomonadaceae bacterium]|nr:cytochrome c [Hyphomonadaceae bacterium]
MIKARWRRVSSVRRMRLLASFLLPLALFACAQTTTTSTLERTGDAAEGRRLAEINCARCHAIGTGGESRHPMAPPFRTLSRNYPVNALEEAFAEGILVGHPAMPEFRLEPAQIDDLLAYIESVQERQGG